MRVPRLPSPSEVMRRAADDSVSGSFANMRRTRRFEPFARLVAELRAGRSRPLGIVDIGGTTAFWEMRGWAGRTDVEIMVVNIEAEERRYANIRPCHGDATDLSVFSDRSFDVVFSNSVIEHLETYERQAAMAHEIRRLAPVYWVQTPNFWFPVEPHLLVPGWHWLPVAVRVWLLQRRRWGWRGPYSDAAEAEAAAREIRLLRKRELKGLFPDARIEYERIGPLVKSLTAVRT